MHAYKTAIKGAAEEYAEMTDSFEAAVVRGRAVSLSDRRAIAEEFARKASTVIVKGSRDWQQDQHAPQWNFSPQPSPTYFFSKRCFFVHIFTMESFGETTGPSKFARNIVFARERSVGGSKTSDDTICTLFELLLSRNACVTPQPLVFRPGYDGNGKIAEVDDE